MEYHSSDWRRLNAYADGELPDGETLAFEQTLAAQPDLHRDLDQLRDLKQRLARLYPSPAEPALHSTAPPSRKIRLPAAIAAAFAALGIVSAIALLWQPEPTTWVAHARALHARQSNQAYVVEERYVVQTVSSGQALEFRPPDLTASRLYLVNIATSAWGDREAIALHYRGLRGCRLTIVAIEANAGADAAAPTVDGMIRTWRYDGFEFAVIADGMDSGRFSAVADYAKSAIVEPMIDDQRMRTAMLESRRVSRPCA
jgi:anti-sigma factor RsiW